MKISGITVVIIGIMLGVISLCYAYFWEYGPNNEEAAYNETLAQQYADRGAMLKKSQLRLEEAKKLVSERVKAWQAIVAVKTPPASFEQGGVDLNVDSWDLTVLAKKYRNSLQTAVNKQVQIGVKPGNVIFGPVIPETEDDASTIVANYFNYPAFNFPVVMFTSNVQVRGTYSEIMANVRAWKNMPNYIAVADGLTLQGTSPILTGNYTVTILGYIRGKTIFMPMPQAGSSGTNPLGGGGGTGNKPAGNPGPSNGGPNVGTRGEGVGKR